MEGGFYSLFVSFSEPKVAPSRVTAKAVLSSEMDVSWEPVEQGDMTGVLLGYEVPDCLGTRDAERHREDPAREIPPG